MDLQGSAHKGAAAELHMVTSSIAPRQHSCYRQANAVASTAWTAVQHKQSACFTESLADVRG